MLLMGTDFYEFYIGTFINIFDGFQFWLKTDSNMGNNMRTDCTFLHKSLA